MAIALDREIRKLLDKAVRKARLVAEDGASKALAELGVEDARKPDGLSREKADLRNRLRAHAQSLGDVKTPNDFLTANRLVREIAYEHWHRALFARFLAENNLLIDPEHKVAVSLSDLEEIAKEDERDFVELAADWAEPMLPQIFRKDDPVLALMLPPETKAGINEIVKGLPRAVFEADDSLGWTYQFWQADEKDRVNESQVKIGADELPAVTQLFTEDYMVRFLLENTLGAWWAARVLAVDPTLAAGAESEEKLREKTSPPGYRWTYLRFVREQREGEEHEAATGSWRPAAGTFEGWPKAAKEITVLDPCMGSGHFLVFALPILIAFRRAQEGFDEHAAVRAVLAENLHGLEIDLRCTQIAAFALALASWKRLGGPVPLPKLNLACSGLAIGLGKAEFLKLAERMADAEGWGGERTLLGTERAPLGDRAAARISGGLERLHELFEKAPYLGSLIDPRKAVTGGDHGYGSLLEQNLDGLDGLLQRALDAGESTVEAHELAVTAQGLAKAAELLSRRYALLATNVPYLGKGKMHPIIARYVHEHFAIAEADLTTVFVSRLRALSLETGVRAIVTPSNWWFQASYSKLRMQLLRERQLSLLVKLGPAAFDVMNWWAAQTSLQILEFSARGETVYGVDASAGKWPAVKSINVVSAKVNARSFDDLIALPGHRFATDAEGGSILLSEYSTSLQGIKSGDDDGNRFCFWEFERVKEDWRAFQGNTLVDTNYGGGSSVIRWGANGSHLARLQGLGGFGRKGVLIGQMRSLPVSIHNGEAFDSNVSALIPKDDRDLLPIFCFCNSKEYRESVRKIDAKVAVANSTLVSVPFDLVHWQAVASAKYPNGLPLPYSNDPTQWLFDGHPRGSADPNAAQNGVANPRLLAPHGVRPGIAEHPLQVAVARLLGYRWPRQTGSSIMDCASLLQPDEIETSGLVDSDGVVPLQALAGEADAATRLRELIRAVWGADYGEATIRDLLASEDANANDLATWLVDEFFSGHCKLFHQTPFIWHVWDGTRGGFSALVNYHRLCEGNGNGRRLLEKLRDSYLGEWIATQRRAVAASEPGAEDRLIAAEHLRGELTKIIEGDPPYDIFVRWKPLHRQPIGWEPDIDDGVRLNIRPFLIAKPKSSGRRDGCILRVTPRVKKHAGADRGAEPHRGKEDFPWFWAEDGDVAAENFTGGPQFKGRRYNDFHFSRAFKQRDRDAKGKRS